MIEFELGNQSISGFNENKIRKWLESVINNEGEDPGEIQFIILNDEALLEINKSYLKHDTLTDIITFDYNTDLGRISGDIYISYDRVIENARKYDVSAINELMRVMVHGILHLIGYNDHNPNSRQLMRDKENYYLSLHGF